MHSTTVTLQDLLSPTSQVSTRMTKLSASWQSAKVVRTREKVSFFFGVMTLLCSALMFGLHPEYVAFSTPKIFYLTSLLQMGTCRIHRSGSLSPAPPLLPVQAASVALFLIRPLLLRQHPQLHLHLDSPWERCSLCRMLLSIKRLPCQCRYHMAKQSCLP